MFLVLAYYEVPSPDRDALAAWAGSVIELIGKSADAETITGNISGLVWRVGAFEAALEMRRTLNKHGVTASLREQ